MRNIISLTLSTSVFLALSACSDSTSERTGLGPIQTAAYEKLEEFEDYSPIFSNDGQKAVFLSTRSSDLPLAYLYDASADVKVIRLDDRLSLDSTDGKESLASINTSGSLVALARTNLAAASNQIIIAQTSGELRATLDLPAGASLNELQFARGSDSFLAYVQRLSGVKTLKVLKVEVTDTAVSFSEAGSFPDQADMSFTLVDGLPTLVSFGAADTQLEQPLSIRSYNEALSTWVTGAEGLKGKVSSLDRSFALTDAGLFTLERLATPKIRNKEGTGPTVGQDLVTEKVSIADRLVQTDVFAKSQTYDFTAAPFLSSEPLGVSAISGTSNGEFLLTSGIDAFSCVASSQQLPVMKLIRRSDMKVVTFLVARSIGTQLWTDLVTNACAVYEDGTSREYDTTINQAELVGQDGDFFLVAIHSFARGDEEIRLVKFKIDFDSGVASDVTITDVSANSR